MDKLGISPSKRRQEGKKSTGPGTDPTYDRRHVKPGGLQAQAFGQEMDDPRGQETETGASEASDSNRDQDAARGNSHPEGAIDATALLQDVEAPTVQTVGGPHIHTVPSPAPAQPHWAKKILEKVKEKLGEAKEKVGEVKESVKGVIHGGEPPSTQGEASSGLNGVGLFVFRVFLNVFITTVKYVFSS